MEYERFPLYLPTTLRHVKDIRNEYCVVAELFVRPHSDAPAARSSGGDLAGRIGPKNNMRLRPVTRTCES